MQKEGDRPPQEEPRTTIIACRICRSDRQFPSCQICVQTNQECSYPLKPKKPGPKIGSSQRNRRRGQGSSTQNRDQQNSRKSSSSPSHAEEDDVDMATAIDIDDGKDVFTYQQDSRPQLELPAVEWDTKRKNSRISINSLSFILHPSHEVTTPEKETSPLAAKDTPSNSYENQGMIQQATQKLGLSQEMIQFMIRVYFDNMVAINLFHEPTFTETIGNSSTPVHVCALVAAMCAYAAKFYNADLDANYEMEFLRAEAGSHSQDHFIAMALKFADQALVECDDDPPPICILQALIITTHCQLTKGVHGKAWRSLGACVRLAYELNLHLVDAIEVTEDGHQDAARWRDSEEKRRAWWAIWEMDVFASTVRRMPAAIDWGNVETLLPVDDADWFANRPTPSAFLETDPVQRWKALQETGNHSPKAWFIVINSLMRDAQLISSSRGLPLQSDSGQRQRAKILDHKTKCRRISAVEKSRQTLSMLANSVQCFLLALPNHLRYRNQYLGFDPPGNTQAGLRHLHAGIYNIYVMTQLARLMIYRYHMFGNHTPSRPHSIHQDPDNPSVRQYFEAADNLLMIVSRSCEDHIQHINPFLSSTIWLGAAAQLVRNYIKADNDSPDLIKSRFDVLYLTYKRCVEFWDTKTAMEQNLESLEMQLEGQKPRSASGNNASRHGSQPIPGVQNENAMSVDRYASRASAGQPKPGQGSEAGQVNINYNKESIDDNTQPPIDASKPVVPIMPNSPPATVVGENCSSYPRIHSTDATTTSRSDYPHQFTLPPAQGSPTMPRMDFGQMARIDGRFTMEPPTTGSSLTGTHGEGLAAMNTSYYYDQGLDGFDMQQGLEQSGLAIPIDVHDMLSGLTTY